MQVPARAAVSGRPSSCLCLSAPSRLFRRQAFISLCLVRSLPRQNESGFLSSCWFFLLCRKSMQPCHCRVKASSGSDYFEVLSRSLSLYGNIKKLEGAAGQFYTIRGLSNYCGVFTFPIRTYLSGVSGKGTRAEPGEK